MNNLQPTLPDEIVSFIGTQLNLEIAKTQRTVRGKLIWRISPTWVNRIPYVATFSMIDLDPRTEPFEVFDRGLFPILAYRQCMISIDENLQQLRGSQWESKALDVFDKALQVNNKLSEMGYPAEGEVDSRLVLCFEEMKEKYLKLFEEICSDKYQGYLLHTYAYLNVELTVLVDASLCIKEIQVDRCAGTIGPTCYAKIEGLGEFPESIKGKATAAVIKRLKALTDGIPK